MNKLDIVQRLKKAVTDNRLVYSMNNRAYESKNYISYSKTDSYLKDRDLDIPVYVEDDCLLIDFSKSRYLSDFVEEYYQLLERLFDKYRKTHDWHILVGSNIVRLFYPKGQDWKGFVDYLTVVCLTASFISSADIKFYIVQEKTKTTKLFSVLSNWGVTMINLGYHEALYPYIMGKIGKRINDITKKTSSDFQTQRLLVDYAKSHFKDLYLVNLGSDSCYLNTSQLKKENIDEMVGAGAADPKRLRTSCDWVVKAWNDKKHLIIYSDLDSPLVLAHEIGHFIIDKSGLWGSVQRNSHYNRGDIYKAVQYIFGGLLGVAADPHNRPKAAYIEMIGTIVSFLANTPTLAVEFLASYNGLKLLEEIGLKGEKLDEAREYYKQAWLTYFAGSFDDASRISKGRLAGSIGRFIYGKARG